MREQESETSFLSGPNAAFIVELYARYAKDPQSVDPGWRAYFASLGEEGAGALADLRGASWAPPRPEIMANGSMAPAIARGANGAAAPEAEAPVASEPAAAGTSSNSIEALRAAATDSIRALQLIRSYRVRGHLEADLDPLGLKPILPHAELDPKTYGFTEADMDRPIFIGNVMGLETATLRQILAQLKATYCGKIGVEFMHIQDPAQKAWIQERIESIRNQTEFTAKGKLAILERLTAAEVFERFLDRKYTGTKRFGLDGGETTIPALEQILKRGSQLGVNEVVVGMAHRGRLNVLANFIGKPFSAIFSEFQGNPANPSHLEAVNTVVLGKVRAKQNQKQDSERSGTMALLLHGDAAFAGQ
ncbi:MAG TPA: 2-oxoglutarate dehydrogenase E1 component, partial [Dongiaceae bacterium]